MGKGKNNFWLDDDPEWEALRRRVNKKPAKKPTPQPRQQSAPIYKPASTPQRPAYKLPPRPTLNSSSPKAAPVPVSNQVPEKPKKVEVSLNLTIPKISKPKIAMPRLSKKQQRLGVAAASIAFVGLAGFGIFNVVQKPSTTD